MTENKENHFAEILHTVLDASPVPTVISRVESGEILYANKAVGQLLGYEDEDVIGRSARDFYVDPNQRDQMVRQLIKSGRITDFEAKLKKANGAVASVIYSGGIMELNEEKVL